MKKQVYEKPLLRKVRLEVKTSVLSTCNTSVVGTPRQGAQADCKLNQCYGKTHP